ncbi:MAG: hypothetical protein KJP03_08135, partial [Gammaproteobacteria bacterium]|nr:hypothetical protein [Gammaproteobacteria bacterium]
MLVGNTLLNLNSYSRIERPAAAPRAAVEAPSVAPVLSFQQLQARDQLIRVLDAVAELDRLVNGSKTVLTGVPSSRSQSALGLDLRDLAATRVSTDEVNANTGSYGPFEPAWNIGATSTSMLTVGGDYNGENGAGDLVLEVLRGGVRGVDRPRIRVYD